MTEEQKEILKQEAWKEYNDRREELCRAYDYPMQLITMMPNSPEKDIAWKMANGAHYLFMQAKRPASEKLYARLQEIDEIPTKAEVQLEQSLRDEVKDRYFSWQHYFRHRSQQPEDITRTWKKYLEADKALKDYLIKHNKYISIKSDPDLVIEDWMVTAVPIEETKDDGRRT